MSRDEGCRDPPQESTTGINHRNQPWASAPGSNLQVRAGPSTMEMALGHQPRELPGMTADEEWPCLAVQT